MIDELVKHKNSEKSHCEIERYEPIDESDYPQEYYKGGIIILDDLNEKEVNDPRLQAMFKNSRPIKLSIFSISQDYHELSKKNYQSKW